MASDMDSSMEVYDINDSVPLLQLPHFVWLKILLYLPQKVRHGVLPRVCKKFNKMILAPYFRRELHFDGRISTMATQKAAIEKSPLVEKVFFSNFLKGCLEDLIGKLVEDCETVKSLGFYRVSFYDFTPLIHGKTFMKKIRSLHLEEVPFMPYVMPLVVFFSAMENLTELKLISYKLPARVQRTIPGGFFPNLKKYTLHIDEEDTDDDLGWDLLNLNPVLNHLDLNIHNRLTFDTNNCERVRRDFTAVKTLVLRQAHLMELSALFTNLERLDISYIDVSLFDLLNFIQRMTNIKSIKTRKRSRNLVKWCSKHKPNLTLE